jgi:PIN domain nuclease of toxin-antitoxin system
VRRTSTRDPSKKRPDVEIALRSRRLEVGTRDLADRFLVSTAIENGFTFVTGDARLKQVPGLNVLAFRPATS